MDTAIVDDRSSRLDGALGPSDAPRLALREHDGKSVGAVRFHQLDGLRAIAASLVVAHHLGTTRMGEAAVARGHRVIGFFVGTVGSSGVELFFVLSGLLLCRPYLRDGRKFDLRRYLERRAVRLFPPYFAAWLACGVFIALASTFPTWWTEGASVPPFDVARWLSQLGIVYFGTHWCFAWWSLSVEVMFYLLIPILIPILARLPSTLPASAAVFLASLGAAAFVQSYPSLVAPLPLEVRALADYAPCFAAGLLMSRRDFPPTLALAGIVVGLVFLGVVSLGWAVPCIQQHIGYGLVYAGIVSLAMGSVGILRRTLSRWWLVWLGERSYSLFLIHGVVMLPVFHGISMIVPHGAAYTLLTRILGLPSCLLAAMILFTFVERRYARGLITADMFWPRPPFAHGLERVAKF